MPSFPTMARESLQGLSCSTVAAIAGASAPARLARVFCMEVIGV